MVKLNILNLSNGMEFMRVPADIFLMGSKMATQMKSHSIL